MATSPSPRTSGPQGALRAGDVGQGILASTIFYAMAAHTPEHVARYAEAAGRAFASIARGDAASRLQGAPAASGFARLT
jgi:hypothetical protein